MFNTISRLFFLALVCTLATSCQRWKKDLAFSEKDADAPVYTTEFEENTSPVK